MRFLFLFFLITVFFSCNSKPKTTKPFFLIGSWERLNNKPNHLTYEMWHSDFKGIGYTLKDKDTVFKEILAIESINDTLFLKVTGVNELPTLFKFISQTDTSFTCENKQNKFPKKIAYWKHHKKLHAQVSNEDFKIDFSFKSLE